MASAQAGVQSTIDVNSSPTVPAGVSGVAKPHVWSWIWFFVALLIIVGFHVRIFGKVVPPTTHFP